MSIFIGWRFDDETSEQIHEWLCGDGCRGIQRPIHSSRLCIPLVFHGGDKMDGFKPMGTNIQHRLRNNPLCFKQCNVRWLGERNTVVLTFQDPKVALRVAELENKGFPRRRKTKKFVARMPLSIHSSHISDKWLKSFPFKERPVQIVEEFAVPFDTGIGAYAHNPMSDEEVWIRQKMTS